VCLTLLTAPGQLGTRDSTRRDVPTAVRTDPDVVTTALTGGSTWTTALGSRPALTTVSGGGRSTPSGSAFSDPLRVGVSGRGIGVAGRAVTFTATGATFAGGASSVTVRTGADGRATAPTLTAGSSLGAISLAATLDGTTSAVSFPLTVLPAPVAVPVAAPGGGSDGRPAACPGNRSAGEQHRTRRDAGPPGRRGTAGLHRRRSRTADRPRRGETLTYEDFGRAARELAQQTSGPPSSTRRPGRW
jgi:hypothetical protein